MDDGVGEEVTWCPTRPGQGLVVVSCSCQGVGGGEGCARGGGGGGVEPKNGRAAVYLRVDSGECSNWLFCFFGDTELKGGSLLNGRRSHKPISCLHYMRDTTKWFLDGKSSSFTYKMRSYQKGTNQLWTWVTALYGSQIISEQANTVPVHVYLWQYEAARRLTRFPLLLVFHWLLSDQCIVVFGHHGAEVQVGVNARPAMMVTNLYSDTHISTVGEQEQGGGEKRMMTIKIVTTMKKKGRKERIQKRPKKRKKKERTNKQTNKTNMK